MLFPKHHGRMIDVDENLLAEKSKGIDDNLGKESHIYKSITSASTVVAASRENDTV